MIVKVDKDTLGAGGDKVASTRILVKCDLCGKEKWGRWNNYKNKPDDYQHLCTACSNKTGRIGVKGKKMSQEFRDKLSERMKKNNPMHDASVRENARDRMIKYYETNTGYWYGKKRDDHSEKMKEILRRTFSTAEEDKDFNPEWRRKLIAAHRRISNIQQKTYSSLILYDNTGDWKLEYEINDGSGKNYIVDIASPSRKITIEIQGCTYHGCKCMYGPDDETFFGVKASELRQKDQDKKEWLESLGWRVIYFYEHDIKKVGFFSNYDWNLILN